MVERMNRTIQESTIKAYEYEGLEQLRQALECAQVKDTIPGDLRGMGKRSKPL
ncbi:hypothetical protein [Delftia sp. UME58]|uniref:hypothetical protein n=1 Tax=Delftia sp. UME58 TaxID=1862322 RepID=UPI00217F2300|nr:hypothetical protein [Delftia sp. UME58]